MRRSCRGLILIPIASRHEKASLSFGWPVVLLQVLDKYVRTHPADHTALFKQGVKFAFTAGIEAIFRELLAELSVPPVLVFPPIRTL